MPIVPFTDYSSSRVMHQQAAELYERMYPWGAEDFVAVTDFAQRCRNEDLYVKMLHQAIKAMEMQLKIHFHISADPGKPTSPPPMPISFIPPPPIIKEVNTTGALNNLRGNFKIPYLYFSYIDARISPNLNMPQEVFRRGLRVPINTVPLLPPERGD